MGRTGQGRPRKASRVSTSPPGEHAQLSQPPVSSLSASEAENPTPLPDLSQSHLENTEPPGSSGGVAAWRDAPRASESWWRVS